MLKIVGLDFDFFFHIGNSLLCFRRSTVALQRTSLEEGTCSSIDAALVIKY